MNNHNIDVKKYLPHRYPFLFVDKVIELSKEHIVAIKNVSHNEPYFNGHFPNEPIMPGVIIVEALAQASGVLAFTSRDKTPADGFGVYLVSTDKVRFRQPVYPGDQLHLHASIHLIKQRLWKFNCRAMVGDKLACSLVLGCVFRKFDSESL